MAEIQSTAAQIQIADEVIAIIAGTAALEIEGVVTTPNHFAPEVAEILGRKNLSRGVKLSVSGNEVAISVNLLVKFGYRVQEVSEAVQKRVATAVETMTGLTVSEVNVNVSGVQPEQKPAKDEK